MSAVQSPLPPGLEIPAPTTGVYLGRSTSGPLSLRLFRPRGTRIVVFSDVFPAQLLTLRAALAGASVRVASSRPDVWMPIVHHGADAQLVSTSGTPSGPTLVVEDRLDASRPLDPAAQWQCLLDVRTIGHDVQGMWTPSHLAHFGQADVAVFGLLNVEMADAAGSVFDLGEAAATLTVVPPHAVAVVTRGSLQLIRLDATAGERQALHGRPG